MRRLTLDLVGRIPTAAEVRAYVDATDPDKQAGLVDRLMATPGFARHQAEAFDALLMTGVKGSLREYLVRAFGEGRTWDEVFRALLVADEAEPARKGTAEFVKARAKDLDRLTSDVSSIFFGVNVSCSKCHDHPRVQDWKQDQFYGMKSFLGRTFMNGNFLGERDYGVVTFKTTAGVERQAKFLFLNGRTVEMPGLAEPPAEVRKEEKRRLAEAKAKNEPPPPPQVERPGAAGRGGPRARRPRLLRPRDRQPPLASLLRCRAGDAPGPDALGEPAEPSRAPGLAGPRPDRAPLRPPPPDPRPGPEPGLFPLEPLGAGAEARGAQRVPPRQRPRPPTRASSRWPRCGP